MMLRSSSTPLLGSLLPPSESPNNHHDTALHPHKSSTIHKFSFPSPGSQHFTPLSCSSSPISPSPSFSNGGMRRAQSEGNLESLMSSSSSNGNDEEFSFFKQPKKVSRLHSSLLETIPSFSYHNSRFKSDEDESSGHEEQEEDDDFHGFNIENKVLNLNKQMDLGIKDDYMRETGSQMYLAKGLGVDTHTGSGAAGGGGGGRKLSQGGGGGGGDNHDVEEHYRKTVNENPGNPLFLRNYAQYLYQSKKDLEGAEEYYCRAILVDPNDGEILSQYAKLLWELHHDKDRATCYFERAVQAASEDSYVHAAYASFLWEIDGEEDEEEEDEEGYYSKNKSPIFNNETMASATA
ncbi:unnamed protein product [Lactuca saligna]|uniref:Uncharacterized protein n=1 Tax=Lactuca saligna TaxID=75948 RepID=A0AA35ZR58_LACSI|nr:unnamed protein product [Lactuca saligna]